MTHQPTAAARRYLEERILNAPPVQLIVLLLEGALRFLDKAEKAMKAGDRPESGRTLNRAMAIVGELKASLEFEEGAPIAQNLDRLYAFVLTQLCDANIQQRTQPLDAARAVLIPIKEGFDAISRRT